MTVGPLALPTRIAFAGDWHANERWAPHAVAYAKELGADVIVHLGDFGYTFDARFMRRTEAALAHHGLPLLFVDGNHECFPTLLRYDVKPNGLRQLTDHIWHLPRGFRWQWAGVSFLALGGAHSVDRPYRTPGASWWKGETVTAEQAAQAIAGGLADVLVTHDCPAGVSIPGLENTSGLFPPLEILRSDEHRQVLRGVVDEVRPRAIWHGHYHRNYSTVADLGYGPVTVTGLDCDGSSMQRNVLVVELSKVLGGLDGRAAT